MSTTTDKHFELAVNLSIEGLKALLLLDGGAAAALIALTDKGEGAQNYSMAIVFFGAGAVAAVTAFIFGYFSQLHYANHLVDIEAKRPFSANYLKHKIFQGVAILAVLAALVFGIMGIWKAYSVAVHRKINGPYAPPTQGEIYNMRTKCAESGQKLLDADSHGPLVSVQQVSRYNPGINRCFVELVSSTSVQFGFDVTTYLYDGQTGEQLGWYRSKRTDPASFAEYTCGVLIDGQLLPKALPRETNPDRCTKINSRFVELMTDNRTN